MRKKDFLYYKLSLPGGMHRKVVINLHRWYKNTGEFKRTQNSDFQAAHDGAAQIRKDTLHPSNMRRLRASTCASQRWNYLRYIVGAGARKRWEGSIRNANVGGRSNDQLGFWGRPKKTMKWELWSQQMQSLFTAWDISEIRTLTTTLWLLRCQTTINLLRR